MKPVVLYCLVGAMGITACLGTEPDVAPVWPVDNQWQRTGQVFGPTALNDPTGKPLGTLTNCFNVAADGSIVVEPGAPTGTYQVEWDVPRPPAAEALEISARLYKHNLNQHNTLLYRSNADSESWTVIGANSKDWTWETVRSAIWPLTSKTNEPIRIRWTFDKPGLDVIHQTRLAGLEVRVISSDQALVQFQQPLAAGLPLLADPRTAKKPWTSKLTLQDNLLLRDGEPFFPIGYVFGTDERSLAEAVAMGCNAVHFEVGWNVSPGPGPIDPKYLADKLAEIDRVGQWGLASFVLLTGHYIPEWFGREYPAAQAAPIGSDGKPTGSWFVYSLHYPPFREQIVNFWKSAAPLLASDPSVMALQFWNEPAYGGAWNRGDQFADYSQWSVANYRQHLQQKYGSLDVLKAAHGQDYASFEEVEPPRQPDEKGRVAWLDWMQYGQQAFADFFNWERQTIHSVAPTVLLANKKQTNPLDNSTASSGTNWRLLSQSEDIFGINAYSGSVSYYRDTLEVARSYARGKPVVVFETNVMPPNARARTPDQIRCQLWAQILGGARGMFIYCLNDSPEHGLLSDKAVSPAARPEYVRFTRTVSSHQRQLTAPHVPARIAVLYSTTAALQYTRDVVPRHVLAALDLFRNSHYQADILPEELCTAEGLAGYELVVLPSRCILKEPGRKALGDFVTRGGKLIAFADSLATDEYLRPIAPPHWLGITGRQNAIGDRLNQKISTVDPTLTSFLDGEISITGVELVSQVQGDARALVPGAAIAAEQQGRVLAYNSDSYPCILQNPAGNVVYCAFEASYSEPERALIEGITRECLGLHQAVRLLHNGSAVAGVMVSLRQDSRDARRRYLLVINTLHRPQPVTIELQDGWQVEHEDFHDLPLTAAVELAPREVYLFELTRANDLSR